MKKVMFIFLLILIIFPHSFAEIDETIDEYIELMQTSPFTEEDLDTYKANYESHESFKPLSLFLSARIELNNFNYKGAYVLLEESLGLLEDQHPQLKAEVLLYLSEIEMHVFDLTQALQRSYDLREFAITNDFKRHIIEANNNIAFGYIYYYDYDAGMKFAEEAFQLSSETNYTLGIVEYFKFLGDFNSFREKHELAIENYYLARKNLKDDYNFYVATEPYFNLTMDIAEEYLYYSDAEKGLDLIQSVTSLVDERNSYDQSYINMLLGDYYTLEDPKLAIQYYEDALEQHFASYLTDNAYPYDQYLLEELGKIYYNLENYERAADYFFSVLSYDYGESDVSVEQTLSNLEELKFSALNNQMNLLEQLNTANEARVALSRKMITYMVISIVILLIAGVFIVIEIRAKSKTEKQLYINSVTDSLTNIYNRGKIIDIFQKNISEDNAVILLDLDDFKEINDTYGHLAGDHVLIEITNIIKKSIRETDKLGRYGGEEFMVFLEAASRDELHEIGERIRRNIFEYEWPYENLKTSASIGVTSCFSEDPEEILHEVDTLMYQAKKSGKNKIAFN